MSRVCKIHGCHTRQDQPDSTAAWISINLSSCKLPSSRWSNTIIVSIIFSLWKILTPVIHRAYLMLNLWLKTCHHSSWRAISSTFSVDFLLSSWSFHPESGFGKLSVSNNSLTKSDVASQFCNKIIFNVHLLRDNCKSIYRSCVFTQDLINYYFVKHSTSTISLYNIYLSLLDSTSREIIT